ncbi:glycoside hydrolase family 2 TIM barrel-domain containing protein [Polaribacter sp. KT 15]|uniref:glycoside hydrolase family 2 TIM barrel-domain containing protein n=1 Tax=Polaribacter sp. KT 15 TaxID=1896175 RepID=UPI00090CAD76|nr:glycoside hydrolase family 2 TIM barrel-domain containing protein [Polaribacter sp. KT 15]SHN04633.1 hypothetical protein SAMN05720268_2407 [Polaribacter sp. KT 15]
MKNYIQLFLLTFLFISCNSETKTDVVSVSKNKILVNNTPYFIKGICYHPVPIGSNKRSFKSIDQDLKLMQEAGINTIRVYEPIADVTVLNKLEKAEIKVIIGFGYKQDGINDLYSGSYLDYIEKFKNHKAILMWELGNEYNYHPEWFDGDILNWYNVMDKAAVAIHKIDSNHPVATAHGELPNAIAYAKGKNIDVWGMNVYRWDNPEEIFTQWQQISSKPMYLSEAGGDSFMTIAKDGFEKGINEKAQAAATSKILNKIVANKDKGNGVTLFSFTDGLWKAGNNNQQDIGGWAPNSSGVPYDGAPNEEFWGIVDINRKKKEVFSIVKNVYSSLDKK